MLSSDFKDYKPYRNPHDNRLWYIYLFKVPHNNIFKGPYIGKYGENDAVAYLGSSLDHSVGWEEASIKEKAFVDIKRFVIKELFK